jgi:hypothetical protein
MKRYICIVAHDGKIICVMGNETRERGRHKSTINRLAVLPPGVNFTNILQAAFLYKVFCAAFMCLQFGFVIFWQKDIGTKAAHKMLVKLSPGGRVGPCFATFIW